MTAYEQRFPNDNKYREEFTEEASKSYIKKMRKLINNDKTREHELAGFVPGLILPNHMMYRIGTLVNQDQIRSYEFLIEYNITKPSEGIYYGCRGITKEGADHEHTIKLFREDWANIKWLLCQVLNNIFPDKDFSSRFKMTDNANTNTYWLFWISLYEDEDINNVGVVATKKIKDVFEFYLEGKAGKPLKKPESKTILPNMAFTNSSYQRLLEQVKNKMLFEHLLRCFEDEGWIEQSPLYDKAWIFKGLGEHNENVDFIAILQWMKSNEMFIDIKKDKMPWTPFASVFLAHDGKNFGTLRQGNQQIKGYTLEFWKDKLNKFNEIIDYYKQNHFT